MSMTVEEGRVRPVARRNAAKCMWALFPHVVLILSLIGYAVLGAVVFQEIEGRQRNDTDEYRNFVRQVVATVRDHSGMSMQYYFNAFIPLIYLLHLCFCAAPMSRDDLKILSDHFTLRCFGV